MVASIVFVVLIISMFLAFVRLVLGPSLPMRVVALDLMASVAVGFIAMDAVATGQPLFLDVAVALALIAFLGTVAFAHFIEKGDLPQRKS
jgi:multicomponent Na+:H+ antiporter subunit F